MPTLHFSPCPLNISSQSILPLSVSLQWIIHETCVYTAHRNMEPRPQCICFCLPLINYPWKVAALSPHNRHFPRTGLQDLNDTVQQPIYVTFLFQNKLNCIPHVYNLLCLRTGFSLIGKRGQLPRERLRLKWLKACLCIQSVSTDSVVLFVTTSL